MRIFVVVAVLLGNLFATAQSLAAATFSLSPTSGPVGTLVTASGDEHTGTGVTLFLDSIGGLTLANGKVNSGKFSVNFSWPTAAPNGTHVVIACIDFNATTTECRSSTSAKFSVTTSTTTSSTTTTTIGRTTTTTSPPTTTTTLPRSTTTTEPGSSTTTLPDSTTTTLAEGSATTTTTVSVFDPPDDLQWTIDNPPPPTGSFSVPTTLPPPAYAPPDNIEEFPDIRATSIEVTQGMQNMDNDMPLVANRRTYVRVYLDVIGADSWAPIGGVLEVWKGNTLLGQLAPENNGAVARADGGDRLELNDSLYFQIPLAWTGFGETRFSALVWSFGPGTLDQEPDSTNNIKHVFVEFDEANPVTVHPVPLHLHRSYHPTDEVRTYSALFGGGAYAQESGASSGAGDIIDGLYRYHPIAEASVEPFPSVLFPLDHGEGIEWDLGPCRTTYLGTFEATGTLSGGPIVQPFEALASWEIFFDDPGSVNEDDLVAVIEDWDWGLVPDRTGLAIMDRRYEVTKVFIEPSTGQVGFWATTLDSSGPDPIEGAPAFVGGCSPDDADYSAPNQVMSFNRVWYDWDSQTDYFVGMVDPSLPTRWGGIANSGYDSAWVKFSSVQGEQWPWNNTGAATLAHELGHLTGLKHAPCRDNDGDGIPDELTGGAIDFTHPAVDWFPDCQLGEIDPDGFYGLDVYHALWGLSQPTVISPDPAAGAPNQAFPLMGYRGAKWTDPYHWCRMLVWYGVDCHPNLKGIPWNPPPPAPTDGAFTGTVPHLPSGDDLDVGFILGQLPNPADGEPGLAGVTIYADINMVPDGDPSWVVDKTLPEDWEGGPPGPYVEVWSADGMLVQRTLIEVELEHDEPTGHVWFQALVAYDPGASIEFRSADGELLGETTVPDDVDSWPTEIVSMDLSGSEGALDLVGPWDSFPDDTMYVLQYSADGEHWLPLATQTGTPITEFDPTVWDRLPGSEKGQLRMLASSGWSGSVIDGPTVNVADKAPVITLHLPVDGWTYATNELVELAASALDPEDRNVTESIQWTSSIDGPLGQGGAVATWELSAGEHLITASVADSAGQVSFVTSTVTVDGAMVQAQFNESDLEFIAAAFADDPKFDAAPAAQEPTPDSDASTPWAWIGLISIAVVAAAGLIRRRFTGSS